MELQLPSRNCWPNGVQLDLLRAGVLRDDRAIAAWARWRDAAARHPAHGRVFPLALWNVRDLTGAADPTGLRPDPLQVTWLGNRRLLDVVLPVLGELAGAGVPLLICKGLALAIEVYPSLAARPIGDVDVLVGPDALASAAAILRRAGWQEVEPRAPSARPHLHSFGFAPPDGGAAIDLHAFALYECAARGFDDGLWARRRALRVGELAAAAPGPGDHLLLLCAHGLRFSRAPAVHWLADAALLLRRAGDALDWQALVSEARRRELEAPLHAALVLLRTELDATVPLEVVAELAPAARRPARRLELRARTAPPTLAGGLYLHWRDYRRARRFPTGPRRPWGFLSYLRALWGLSRWLELPVVAARKAWRRRRGPIT